MKNNLNGIMLKYALLQDLNPKNWLLEYVIFENGKQNINPEKELDMLEKFGDGFPEFKNMGEDISLKEYGKQKLEWAIGNYEKAIDGEILKHDRNLLKRWGLRV